MRILIITLANPFTKSMLYKENYIIKAAIENGDEVAVFARNLEYVCGKEQLTLPGVENCESYYLKRYEYRSLGNKTLTEKIKIVDGVVEDVIAFKPDLIFMNSAQIYLSSQLHVIKKALPNVKIVMDISTKYINSARNWLSLHVLHGLIYRRWLKKALPYVDRIFYISQESKDFIKEVYKIPDTYLEHNNLPGELICREKREKINRFIRDREGIGMDAIVITNSGKIGKLKKTIELMKAFSTSINPNFRLVIIGSIEDEIKEVFYDLLKKDNRIIYKGFLSGDELTEYLCATDLYVQPGTISQTSQTAICCGCPIAFTSVETNKEIFNHNGFFIDNEQQMEQLFKSVKLNKEDLYYMSEKSYQLALNELDYRVIYNKILKAVNL